MFREHSDIIRADFDKRGLDHSPIDAVISADTEWRQCLHETDKLRREKNEAARGIGQAKKDGDEQKAQTILKQVADIGYPLVDGDT